MRLLLLILLSASIPSFAQALGLELSSVFRDNGSSRDRELGPQLRLNLLEKNRSSLMTPELEFGFSFPLRKESERRQSLALNLAFYEFFGSRSFRFAFGFGVLRQPKQYSILGQYRIGLGQSLGESWAIWADLGGRSIQNENDRFELELVLELSLLRF